jgi:ParB family chromosome partitioning protein
MSSDNPLTGFLESVELSKIHPSRRGLRSQMGSLEELIASIEEKGLLEPIVVRPVENGFEVVAGNRRLEACRRLKMHRIPCHIVELDDREAFEVSLVENVQHETMNPIDEARAFKRYVDDYGYGGVSELAKKIGKSQEYVSNRLRLLSLPNEVQEEVIRRRITVSAAQELASMNDKVVREVIKIAGEQHLSMREVRTIAKYYRKTSQQGELSSFFDLGANYPDPWERRTRRIDRALARAVASLKMDKYRLKDVIYDVEDEGDEWVVREILLQCMRGLNEQIDMLLRFRKRFMRARGR